MCTLLEVANHYDLSVLPMSVKQVWTRGCGWGGLSSLFLTTESLRYFRSQNITGQIVSLWNIDEKA